MAFFVERPGPGERAQQMPENMSLTEALCILTLNWMAATSSLLPEPSPRPQESGVLPHPIPRGSLVGGSCLIIQEEGTGLSGTKWNGCLRLSPLPSDLS